MRRLWISIGETGPYNGYGDRTEYQSGINYESPGRKIRLPTLDPGCYIKTGPEKYAGSRHLLQALR